VEGGLGGGGYFIRLPDAFALARHRKSFSGGIRIEIRLAPITKHDPFFNFRKNQGACFYFKHYVCVGVMTHSR
jgi:hypothetical protein